ncbi:MAG: hypothetical protein GVY26_20170 [Bacteroidetes bacterium]|nr:hypothetical protein [Bacteroidota bacterium]
MKVRFTDNSVRMRVRKSDLNQLKTEGQTRTHIQLQPALSFVLTIGDTPAPTAQMQGSTLTVTLPRTAAQQWVNSEQVGIEHEQEQADGSRIHLLIEKDFPCAHRPQEDKADTFEGLS